MRGVGWLIAMFSVAGCGGPGSEVSSNAVADRHDQNAAADKDDPAAIIEARPPSDPVRKTEDAQAARVSECLLQGTDRLQVASIRAVGTEPFWGARVEGRCVTYSTPENQQGIRVWTRYSAGPNGRAAWAGQLDGKLFEMRVRPEAGCSDGMSDQRYPLAVELLVNGEQRRGCAEAL